MPEYPRGPSGIGFEKDSVILIGCLKITVNLRSQIQNRDFPAGSGVKFFNSLYVEDCWSDVFGEGRCFPHRFMTHSFADEPDAAGSGYERESCRYHHDILRGYLTGYAEP